MIRTAVIGCGYWGPNFIRILNQHPQSRLMQICDLDPSRLEALSGAYREIDKTTDPDTVIHNDDVEALVICTPVGTHYDLVKAALQAGKHVLCEKPVTQRSDQALELHELAKSKDLIYMAGHTFLFNEAIRYIKKKISGAEFGSVVHCRFVRAGLGPVRSDVNAIWDLAAHDVSIILYLLEQIPVAVTAFGTSGIQEGIEDVAFIVLEFPNRVLINMHVSWLEPSKIRTMTIVGKNQMIVFDDVSINEKVRIYDKGITYDKASDDFGDFQLALREGHVMIPHIQIHEPLKTEMDHFLHCIDTGQQPLTDGYNGYEVVRVLEAAQQSMDQGNIKVPL